MRLLRILLVLAGAGAGALAQTNPTGVTNAPGAAVVPSGLTNSTTVTNTYNLNAPGAAVSPTAQTNALPARRLSLKDVIQLALQQNLDLQIDRYGPQIALFTLNGSYGAYDPTLNLSGQHDHTERGASLIGGQIPVANIISDDNTFSSRLSGTSPIGTTYSLFGSASDTYGTFPETSSGQAGFNITQPLLKNFWIDQYRLTISVAKNRLKYSEYLLKLQIMQTITQLEQACYDLIYNRENVIVQEKAVELAERLVAENKKRLEVGALAPLDLQSAEAQAASTRAAVILARS